MGGDELLRFNENKKEIDRKSMQKTEEKQLFVFPKQIYFHIIYKYTENKG